MTFYNLSDMYDDIHYTAEQTKRSNKNKPV